MTDQDPDAYELLQVADAHASVIQAAYRALAALYHPDRNQSLGTDKRMAELNAAYEALRTPARRELYDRMLSAARAVRSPPWPRYRHRRQRRSRQVVSAPWISAATKDGRIRPWRGTTQLPQVAGSPPSGIRYRSRIKAAVNLPPRSPRTA